MPTTGWNQQHYAWDAPQGQPGGRVEPYRSDAPRMRPDEIEPYGQGPGAAIEHWSQGSRDVEPYRPPQRSARQFQPGPRRAASQARVVSAMAHGSSDAAAFRMYSARPFSQERRDARRQWRRAEEYAIQADALSWALTRESMLGEFFGDF